MKYFIPMLVRAPGNKILEQFSLGVIRNFKLKCVATLDTGIGDKTADNFLVKIVLSHFRV